MRPSFSAGRAALLGATAAALLSGCVYRLDTQQGNILDSSQIEQVQVGMTRSQVRFVLGTPMIADPFDQSRWDYVYWQRRGTSGRVSKTQVTVWFEGDEVARIDRPASGALPGDRPAPKTLPAPGADGEDSAVPG